MGSWRLSAVVAAAQAMEQALEVFVAPQLGYERPEQGYKLTHTYKSKPKMLGTLSPEPEEKKMVVLLLTSDD